MPYSKQDDLQFKNKLADLVAIKMSEDKKFKI